MKRQFLNTVENLSGKFINFNFPSSFKLNIVGFIRYSAIFKDNWNLFLQCKFTVSCYQSSRINYYVSPKIIMAKPGTECSLVQEQQSKIKGAEEVFYGTAIIAVVYFSLLGERTKPYITLHGIT